MLMGLIWQGTGFAFIWLVLSQFHLLGGWSLSEIAFLYGFRLIVHACSVLIFGLFQRVEDIIRRGDFDRFLVRPVAPFLQVITYKFSISSCGDLLGGLSIFLVSSVMLHFHWHPFTFMYLLLMLIGGCLIETAIKLAASAFTFRTLSSWQVVSFFENSMDIAASYPFTIYNTLTSFLLTFVLPLAFIAYLPVTVLLGRSQELAISPLFAYLTPAFGLILFLLAYALFEYERKQYQSAGH